MKEEKAKRIELLTKMVIDFVDDMYNYVGERNEKSYQKFFNSVDVFLNSKDEILRNKKFNDTGIEFYNGKAILDNNIESIWKKVTKKLEENHIDPFDIVVAFNLYERMEDIENSPFPEFENKQDVLTEDDYAILELASLRQGIILLQNLQDKGEMLNVSLFDNLNMDEEMDR